MVKTIGNPLSWIADAVGRSSRHVGAGTLELGRNARGDIEIRGLEISDLMPALRKGWDDFMALRTDVMFLVLIYPVIGILLAWFAINRELLPLLFPMLSGFALLGPVAAIGLYEMSRRRETGKNVGWSDALAVIASPSLVPIVVLGLALAVLFILWMFAAYTLYNATLGPQPPVSIAGLIGDVLTTGAGWTMLIAGMGIGFFFAVFALAISLISFPLLIDREVGLANAVVTSVRICRDNPVVVAAWGAIIAGLLALGIATFFVGLIFVLPVLGHATWHLYRRAVI